MEMVVKHIIEPEILMVGNGFVLFSRFSSSASFELERIFCNGVIKHSTVGFQWTQNVPILN